MSDDLEIIEVDEEIIEISDDDSLLEECSKVLLRIRNFEEQIDEENNIYIEPPHEHEKITEHESIDAVNHSSLQIRISEPITLEDTSNKSIRLDYKNPQPENNDSDVACNENSQENEIIKHDNNINNVDQHVSLENGTAELIKNSQYNRTLSEKPVNSLQRNKARRIRTRIRKGNKVLKSTGSGNGKATKTSQKTVFQRESNSSNKIDEIINTNFTASEEPTCSSNIGTHISCSYKRCNNYDISKLEWLKPLSSLSSPPHLQIVIIDRSHPDWKIANEKWLMIERRLLEVLNSEMLRTNDTSIGLFDGAKWQRGIKIVGCHNENAFNFIMEFIINLDKLWNGAQLDAFSISHITRRIVKAYIPPPTLKTELIMSLINLQNPSICTKDWKVVKERERSSNCGVDVWISVNEESFTQLCKSRGEIKYGINRIWLNPS